jgi:hypothetical protein
VDQKSLGFLGVVVAATALMRVGGSDVPQRTPEGRVAHVAPAPASPAGLGCRSDPDPDGPWKAAQAYFELRYPVAATNSCKPDGSGRFPCVPRDSSIRFLIASVPDPDATHLALYFDRSVESMLWAAADAGYSFERYWLPWNTEPLKDLFLLQDQECQRKDSETRHTLPGLLVFHETRHPDRSLFLFLVGETPTSGVNKDAWTHALQYVRELEPKGNGGRYPIDVVGPSFSGSLAPLGTDIKAMPAQEYWFHFISGTVTNGDAIEAFRTAIHGMGELESVIERDDRANYVFLRFAAAMWKDPAAVAVLAEDETAYGSSNGRDVPSRLRPILVRFRIPREISRLRNSYQEASAAAPQAGKTPAPAPGVQFTLKDAASDADLLVEKDSVPAFSRLQSPASQQAVLGSVSETLRHDRVDLAGIVATDILDALFLSRFLRTVSPDTRIYTLDSDLLFLPQSNPSTPMGMLSITSYPLLGRERRRLPEMDGVSNVTRFASSYAQGSYTACTSLFADNQKPEFAEGHGVRPPLWLTTVGRDGYWPIAKLDFPSVIDKQAPPTILPQAVKIPEDEDTLLVEKPSWGWFVLFWASTLLGVLHCLYSLFLAAGPHTPKRDEAGHAVHPWHATLFTLLGKIFRTYPDGNRMMSPQEWAFLACISIAAACGVFLVDAPLIRFTTLRAFEDWAPAYLAIAGLVILGMLLTAAVLVLGGWGIRILGSGNIEIPHPPEGGSRPEEWKQVWRRHQHMAFVFFGCLTAGYLAWNWIRLLTRSEYQTGYYFAYRCLSLTSGVAPGVPFVLATMGFLWWGCARLKCEGMIEERHSVMRHEPPAVLGAGLTHRIDDSIENLFSFRIWAPAIPYVLVWLQLFIPVRSFRSLEHVSYANLYTVVVLLFYWAVAVAWMQFLWCWGRLRVLLQWLERQAVRNAFSRLRKEGSWVPLVTSPREHTLFITSRCWDCLKAILSFDLDEESWSDIDRHRRLTQSLKADAGEIRRLLDEIESGLSSGFAVDRDKYATLQVHMEGAAHILIDDLTESEWQQGGSDSLSGLKASDEDAAHPLLVLKEEFVALRCLIYMRYVFRHLRVLLGFVIVGFIVSVVSMSSYPFQGHRWIGGANSVVCLALGLGVITVFAQMDRDAIMSRITATKANELGRTFFLRVAQYGALPLATLLSSQFPEVSRFLFSWLQPAIEAIK